MDENFKAEFEINGEKRSEVLAMIFGIGLMLGVIIFTPILAVLDLFFRARGGRGFYFREGNFFLFDDRSFRK